MEGQIQMHGVWQLKGLGSDWEFFKSQYLSKEIIQLHTTCN